LESGVACGHLVGAGDASAVWRGNRARCAGTTRARTGAMVVRASGSAKEDLWDKYLRTRRRAFKDRLVESYMAVVRSVAEQLALRLPRTVDEEDLMSAGVFGLFKAIENFDPDRNVKFETYCRLRVRGAMIDFLRQQDWIPREARNRGSRLHDVI